MKYLQLHLSHAIKNYRIFFSREGDYVKRTDIKLIETVRDCYGKDKTNLIAVALNLIPDISNKYISVTVIFIYYL